MGYVLKKSNGGGGDATAANQTTQISLETGIYETLGAINSNIELIKGSYISAGGTIVTTFTSTTLSGVAALLQTFLQANPNLFIVNISFSSSGIAQHDVLLTYNN